MGVQNSDNDDTQECIRLKLMLMMHSRACGRLEFRANPCGYQPTLNPVFISNTNAAHKYTYL